VSALAEVRMWGSPIGAVSMGDDGGSDAGGGGAGGSSGGVAVFQYSEDFLGSGIEVSPLAMPLRPDPYTFGALNPESFHGLPGLLADSLPDRYGHALIDAWLAGQGRAPESFDSVERLCYVGRRGMGALEFLPTRGPKQSASHDLQVAALVELASEVLSRREELVSSLAAGHQKQAMLDILSVGASAGGARAKAVIAWNPTTETVRSGQLDDLSPGFEHWLLKFDGVANNRDRDTLADPQGYGAIEYAYALMTPASR
jgi:serine/threonine-protein kinase HipA